MLQTTNQFWYQWLQSFASHSQLFQEELPVPTPMTSHKFHTQHWHLHDISRFVFVNLHFVSVILHSYQSLPANHGQTTFSDAGSFIFPKTMEQLIPKHPQFHPLFGRWFPRWLSYLFKGDLFGDLHIFRCKVLNSGISWAQDATDSFERQSDARKFRFLGSPLGTITHRIHGAGIYANMTGVYWW